MRTSILRCAWILAVGLLCASASGDPRVELVRLQLERDTEGVLVKIDEHLATAGPTAKAQGMPYLEARLLLESGRRAAAEQALTDALSDSPSLAPWARYRLALLHEAEGRPSVAAGVVASLLGSGPPDALLGPSVELLERTLAEAGDCRVLRGLGRLKLRDPYRRRLDLARAACARRSDQVKKEAVLLEELLAENTRDDPAYVAAERLSELLDPRRTPPETAGRLGLAYFHHRLFERAAELLEPTVDAADRASAGADKKTAEETEDLRYSLARSHFWLGRYDEAARIFATVADRAPVESLAAKARYQQARSHELAGSRALSRASKPKTSKSEAVVVSPADRKALPRDAEASWKRAAALFAQAAEIDPESGWASAARVGRLRLLWLLGEREASLRVLDELRREGRPDNVARALVFLAASDLAEERTDRAGAWLQEARKGRQVPDREIAYWQGRLAELEGRPGDAVGAYVEALETDPLHPFGEAARGRLVGKGLAPHALQAGVEAAGGDTTDDLYRAVLLLGKEHPLGIGAERALRERLDRDSKAGPFLRLAPVPAADWPLWKKRLLKPEDQLLGLGLFDEPGTRVLRHFPIADPSLALTGSLALSERGAVRRSMYIAEVLLRRVPDRLPRELLPLRFRQLLYPFRYSFLILRESRKRGVDPHLLTGLIREESRFDPDAFSGASARGLTQFVYPTAREIAAAVELGEIVPGDLHRPEISVALGAAYLRRLLDASGGDLSVAVAAYNAGEPQAILWKHYCLGDDPAEYWSKIAFRETRSYVRKVLTSRAWYRELYGKGSTTDDGETPESADLGKPSPENP